MIVRRYFLSFAAVLAVWLFSQSPLIAQSPLGPLLAPAADQTLPRRPPRPRSRRSGRRTPSCCASPNGRSRAIRRTPPRPPSSRPTRPPKRSSLSRRPSSSRFTTSTCAKRSCARSSKTGRRPPASRWQAISFVEFDRLVNRLAAEQARTELVRSKLKAAKAALESAQTELNTREQERRKAQEALEAGKDGPDAATLASPLDEAKRASALATDNVALRKKELEREKLADTVQGLTVELLKGKVDRYQPLVVFTEAELQEQLQGSRRRKNRSARR